MISTPGASSSADTSHPMYLVYAPSVQSTADSRREAAAASSSPPSPPPHKLLLTAAEANAELPLHTFMKSLPDVLPPTTTAAPLGAVQPHGRSRSSSRASLTHHATQTRRSTGGTCAAFNSKVDPARPTSDALWQATAFLQQIGDEMPPGASAYGAACQHGLAGVAGGRQNAEPDRVRAHLQYLARVRASQAEIREVAAALRRIERDAAAMHQRDGATSSSQLAAPAAPASPRGVRTSAGSTRAGEARELPDGVMLTETRLPRLSDAQARQPHSTTAAFHHGSSRPTNSSDLAGSSARAAGHLPALPRTLQSELQKSQARLAAARRARVRRTRRPRALTGGGSSSDVSQVTRPEATSAGSREVSPHQAVGAHAHAARGALVPVSGTASTAVAPTAGTPKCSAPPADRAGAASVEERLQWLLRRAHMPSVYISSSSSASALNTQRSPPSRPQPSSAAPAGVMQSSSRRASNPAVLPLANKLTTATALPDISPRAAQRSSGTAKRASSHAQRPPRHVTDAGAGARIAQNFRQRVFSAQRRALETEQRGADQVQRSCALMHRLRQLRVGLLQMVAPTGDEAALLSPRRTSAVTCSDAARPAANTTRSSTCTAADTLASVGRMATDEGAAAFLAKSRAHTRGARPTHSESSARVFGRHRRQLHAAAASLDEAEQLACRLQYIDLVEELCCASIPEAARPAAEAILTDCRQLARAPLVHRPKHFGTLQDRALQRFSMTQLMLEPVQALLRRLATLFEVPTDSFALWVRQLAEQLHGARDYHARFTAVDRALQRRENVAPVTVRVTLHICRRLPGLSAASPAGPSGCHRPLNAREAAGCDPSPEDVPQLPQTVRSMSGSLMTNTLTSEAVEPQSVYVIRVERGPPAATPSTQSAAVANAPPPASGEVLRVVGHGSRDARGAIRSLYLSTEAVNVSLPTTSAGITFTLERDGVPIGAGMLEVCSLRRGQPQTQWLPLKGKECLDTELKLTVERIKMVLKNSVRDAANSVAQYSATTTAQLLFGQLCRSARAGNYSGGCCRSYSRASHVQPTNAFFSARRALTCSSVQHAAHQPTGQSGEVPPPASSRFQRRGRVAKRVHLTEAVTPPPADTSAVHAPELKKTGSPGPPAASSSRDVHQPSKPRTRDDQRGGAAPTSSAAPSDAEEVLLPPPPPAEEMSNESVGSYLLTLRRAARTLQLSTKSKTINSAAKKMLLDVLPRYLDAVEQDPAAAALTAPSSRTAAPPRRLHWTWRLATEVLLTFIAFDISLRRHPLSESAAAYLLHMSRAEPLGSLTGTALIERLRQSGQLSSSLCRALQRMARETTFAAEVALPLYREQRQLLAQHRAAARALMQPASVHLTCAGSGAAAGAGDAPPVELEDVIGAVVAPEQVLAVELFYARALLPDVMRGLRYLCARRVTGASTTAAAVAFNVLEQSAFSVLLSALYKALGAHLVSRAGPTDATQRDGGDGPRLCFHTPQSAEHTRRSHVPGGEAARAVASQLPAAAPLAVADFARGVHNFTEAVFATWSRDSPWTADDTAAPTALGDHREGLGNPQSAITQRRMMTSADASRSQLRPPKINVELLFPVMQLCLHGGTFDTLLDGELSEDATAQLSADLLALMTLATAAVARMRSYQLASFLTLYARALLWTPETSDSPLRRVQHRVLRRLQDELWHSSSTTPMPPPHLVLIQTINAAVRCAGHFTSSDVASLTAGVASIYAALETHLEHEKCCGGVDIPAARALAATDAQVDRLLSALLTNITGQLPHALARTKFSISVDCASAAEAEEDHPGGALERRGTTLSHQQPHPAAGTRAAAKPVTVLLPYYVPKELGSRTRATTRYVTPNELCTIAEAVDAVRWRPHAELSRCIHKVLRQPRLTTRLAAHTFASLLHHALRGLPQADVWNFVEQRLFFLLAYTNERRLDQTGLHDALQALTHVLPAQVLSAVQHRALQLPDATGALREGRRHILIRDAFSSQDAVHLLVHVTALVSDAALPSLISWTLRLSLGVLHEMGAAAACPRDEWRHFFSAVVLPLHVVLCRLLQVHQQPHPSLQSQLEALQLLNHIFECVIRRHLLHKEFMPTADSQLSRHHERLLEPELALHLALLLPDEADGELPEVLRGVQVMLCCAFSEMPDRVLARLVGDYLYTSGATVSDSVGPPTHVRQLSARYISAMRLEARLEGNQRPLCWSLLPFLGDKRSSACGTKHNISAAPAATMVASANKKIESASQEHHCLPAPPPVVLCVERLLSDSGAALVCSLGFVWWLVHQLMCVEPLIWLSSSAPSPGALPPTLQQRAHEVVRNALRTLVRSRTPSDRDAFLLVSTLLLAEASAEPHHHRRREAPSHVSATDVHRSSSRDDDDLLVYCLRTLNRSAGAPLLDQQQPNDNAISPSELAAALRCLLWLPLAIQRSGMRFLTPMLLCTATYASHDRQHMTAVALLVEPLVLLAPELAYPVLKAMQMSHSREPGRRRQTELNQVLCVFAALEDADRAASSPRVLGGAADRTAKDETPEGADEEDALPSTEPEESRLMHATRGRRDNCRARSHVLKHLYKILRPRDVLGTAADADIQLLARVIEAPSTRRLHKLRTRALLLLLRAIQHRIGWTRERRHQQQRCEPPSMMPEHAPPSVWPDVLLLMRAAHVRNPLAVTHVQSLHELCCALNASPKSSEYVTRRCCDNKGLPEEVKSIALDVWRCLIYTSFYVRGRTSYFGTVDRVVRYHQPRHRINLAALAKVKQNSSEVSYSFLRGGGGLSLFLTLSPQQLQDLQRALGPLSFIVLVCDVLHVYGSLLTCRHRKILHGTLADHCGAQPESETPSAPPPPWLLLPDMPLPATVLSSSYLRPCLNLAWRTVMDMIAQLPAVLEAERTACLRRACPSATSSSSSIATTVTDSYASSAADDDRVEGAATEASTRSAGGGAVVLDLGVLVKFLLALTGLQPAMRERRLSHLLDGSLSGVSAPCDADSRAFGAEVMEACVQQVSYLPLLLTILRQVQRWWPDSDRQAYAGSSARRGGLHCVTNWAAVVDYCAAEEEHWSSSPYFHGRSAVSPRREDSSAARCGFDLPLVRTPCATLRQREVALQANTKVMLEEVVLRCVFGSDEASRAVGAVADGDAARAGNERLVRRRVAALPPSDIVCLLHILIAATGKDSAGPDSFASHRGPQYAMYTTTMMDMLAELLESADAGEVVGIVEALVLLLERVQSGSSEVVQHARHAARHLLARVPVLAASDADRFSTVQLRTIFALLHAPLPGDPITIVHGRHCFEASLVAPQAAAAVRAAVCTRHTISEEVLDTVVMQMRMETATTASCRRAWELLQKQEKTAARGSSIMLLVKLLTFIELTSI